MTTKRPTKAKLQSDGDNELKKVDNTAKRAADMLGIHEFSLDVLAAHGVPGTPPIYGEIVETLAEIAKAYGVS